MDHRPITATIHGSNIKSQLSIRRKWPGKTDCITTTVTCTSPLAPTVIPTTATTIFAGSTVSYNVSNISGNTWYGLTDDSGNSYATSLYTNSATNFSLTTSALRVTGTYNLKLTADKLTGGPASFATTSIVVKGITLPVTFVTVTAKKESDDRITVAWTVANEQQVRYYEVERSLDCRNYTPIGKMYYQAGNSNNKLFALPGRNLQGCTYKRSTIKKGILPTKNLPLQ